MVAFPLAPVGLAQAGRYGLAPVLDRDDEPRFFLRVAEGSMQPANGLVGTLWDEYAGARLDVDGLPGLIQLQAERFPMTRSSETDDNFTAGRTGKNNVACVRRPCAVEAYFCAGK